MTARYDDRGSHGVLKFRYALKSDGIWRGAVFTVELAGSSPFDQRRAIAEIFDGMEEAILTSDPPTVSHFLDA